ncbi:nuclear pore complex protein Nup160-like [Ranitomeya variabilis]|uniref:nuclear pore complex protein Nup160-like n=1 Tax=Ranitomeya variabilis TaxID=490064 RepID=UPI0040566F96
MTFVNTPGAIEILKEEDVIVRRQEAPDRDAHRIGPPAQVLHLLERVDFPELLIQLATLAISETVDGLKSQATLRTRILQASPGFRTQPPVVQRCHAFSRSQQVVSIIEARAQVVDLLTHNYYEILYAFHIHRHNYLKADTVMIVYRMHLSREVRTLIGLQKQVNAYLACLTCLQLIRSEYSWIVQPALGAVGKKCIVTGVFLSRDGFSSQAFMVKSVSQHKCMPFSIIASFFLLQHHLLQYTILRHLPNSSLSHRTGAAHPYP